MRHPSLPLPGTTILPRFPDSDGRPMGDTQFHTNARFGLYEALEVFFAGAPDWLVASNLMFYWDFDDPRRRRDPDILVARAKNYPRRAFRVWEEKTVPCTLFEILSRKTWRVDVGPKKEEYARIDVPEYFLFDPEVQYLNPPLQGFRLREGVYVPIKWDKGYLPSDELGVRMTTEGQLLRLYDGRTGARVLTRLESIAEAKRRAEREREQADWWRRLADSERRRAEDVKRFRQRNNDLAAEVERLRDELRRRDGAN